MLRYRFVEAVHLLVDTAASARASCLSRNIISNRTSEDTRNSVEAARDLKQWAASSLHPKRTAATLLSMKDVSQTPGLSSLLVLFINTFYNNNKKEYIHSPRWGGASKKKYIDGFEPSAPGLSFMSLFQTSRPV